MEHESYSRAELDGRIAWAGVGKTRPVDAAGRLPRGEEFKSFAEFKRLVVSELECDGPAPGSALLPRWGESDSE